MGPVLDTVDKIIKVLALVDESVIDLEVFLDEVPVKEALSLFKEANPIHVAGYFIGALGEMRKIVNGHHHQKLQ